MALNVGNIEGFIGADNSAFISAVNESVRAADRLAKRTEQRFKAVGQSMVRLGQTASIAITAPIVAAQAAVTKAAIDAEETRNKFQVIFRDMSTEAEAMADQLTTSYGLGATESKELLAAGGDLLTGLKFTQKTALGLSSQVVALAADLTSFQNIEGGVAWATEGLIKALLGEAEQAKALGIIIRQNSDEYKTLVKRFQEAEGATLDQAKAQAALTIAINQSQNAIGDYGRTAGQTANQLRLFKVRLIDAAEVIGVQLIPSADRMVALGFRLLNAWNALDPVMRSNIIKFAGIAAAIGPTLLIGGKFVSMVGTVIGVAGTAVTVMVSLASALAALVIPIGAAVAGGLLLWEAFGGLVDVSGLVEGGFNGIQTAITLAQNVFSDFVRFFRTGELETKSTTDFVVKAISEAWLSLKIVWKSVIIGLKTVAQSVLVSFSLALKGFAVGLTGAQGLFGLFTSTANLGLKALSNSLGLLIETFSKVAVVLQKITSIPGIGIQFSSAALAVDALVPTLETLKSGFDSVSNGMETTSGKMLEFAIGAQNVADEMLVVGAAIEKSKDKQLKAIAALASSYGTAPEQMRADLERLKGFLTETGTKAFDALRGLAPEAMNSLKGLIAKVNAAIAAGAVPPVRVPIDFNQTGAATAAPVPAIGPDLSKDNFTTRAELRAKRLAAISALENKAAFTAAAELAQNERDALAERTTTWDNFIANNIASLENWRNQGTQLTNSLVDGFAHAFSQMQDGAETFEKSLLNTMKRIRQQVIAQLIKMAIAQLAVQKTQVTAQLAVQKAQVTAQLALNQVQVIGNSAGAAPTPWMIPVFVAAGLVAFAAAVGLADSGAFGSGSSGGDGMSASASASIAPEAVSQTTIREDDPADNLNPTQRFVFETDAGEQLLDVLVKKSKEGAGDGVDRFLTTKDFDV